MTATNPFKSIPFTTRGADFFDSVTAEYDLSKVELQLLSEACKTLDDLEKLAEALETDGVVVAGSTGQKRANPLIQEIRQHRLLAGKLLSQLDLPDDQGETLATPLQARARSAGRAGAKVRWNG
jgi:hypothetical protein